MKKLMIISAICLLPISSLAESAKEGIQPLPQKWITSISDDIKVDKTPRDIPCYTKVDCRQKGKGFTTITFQPKAFEPVKDYPGQNLVWSHENQGYVQRKLHLD